MLKNTVLGKTTTLTDSQLCSFFADQLRCIYKSEKQLTPAVITMQEAVTMVDLKELFTKYLEQVHRQIIKLEEIFKILLITSDGERCDTMEGLTKEINHIIQHTPAASMTRDAAIIIAAQKAAHYKIATYGSLAQLATSLGMEDITNLLHQSLQDEKDNDRLLSHIADRRVNWLAETE